MSFTDCKKLIGAYFIITPCNKHWSNHPLKLIRHSNNCLTFFSKIEMEEIRFDLREEYFKAFTVNKI